MIWLGGAGLLQLFNNKGDGALPRAVAESCGLCVDSMSQDSLVKTLDLVSVRNPPLVCMQEQLLLWRLLTWHDAFS